MQRLEVSGAVRPLYGSLGVKGLNLNLNIIYISRCRHIIVHYTTNYPIRAMLFFLNFTTIRNFEKQH